MNHSFVCIDIETTSQKPEKNEIIEIGCVYVVNGIKEATYHRVFKPHKKIPKFIYTLTGLKQSDIDSANGIEDSISEIQAFLKDHICIAHNASFDMDILNREFKRYGYPKLQNSVIDSQELCKILLPHLHSHKQENLLRHYQIKQDHLHRALDDANGLSEIMICLLNEINNCPTAIHTLVKLKKQHEPYSKLFMDTDTVKLDAFTDLYNTDTPSSNKIINQEPTSLDEIYKECEKISGFEKREGQKQISQFIWDQFNDKHHGYRSRDRVVNQSIPISIYFMEPKK